MKNSLVLYFQQYEAIKGLSLEDKGLLLDVVFGYAMSGEIPSDLPPLVSMAFSFIRTAMDIDSEKYEKKCERNKENIRKRWNDFNTKEYDRIESNNSNTKHTDTDTDTDINIVESFDSTSELSFDFIWSLYEKKGNKKTSINRWNKLSSKNKKLALNHIPLYVRSTPDKRFRKNFEVYINQEVWNDELPINKQQNEAKTEEPRYKFVTAPAE
ncbi:DUF6291 domain-containing protein [Parabacteroides sp. PF5-9]|uniref:DUF6291 domain-containing protein n=1 Tax=Parabacteroides sp. PF5-9 TaxID=1742404 RepID=UPI002476296F|nr:DUF6291 domain-containing protein [Parabacteroides sp. PF5-9]